MKNLTIAELRGKTGLTQKEFGKLLGMTQPAVNRIESGRRTETKGHLATLAALDLIIEKGMLDLLL